MMKWLIRIPLGILLCFVAVAAQPSSNPSSGDYTELIVRIILFLLGLTSLGLWKFFGLFRDRQNRELRDLMQSSKKLPKLDKLERNFRKASDYKPPTFGENSAQTIQRWFELNHAVLESRGIEASVEIDRFLKLRLTNVMVFLTNRQNSLNCNLYVETDGGYSAHCSNFQTSEILLKKRGTFDKPILAHESMNFLASVVTGGNWATQLRELP
jgi:hypothetical protein